MNVKQGFSATLLLGFLLSTWCLAEQAPDEVLEVEIFNVGPQAIEPGDGFTWRDDPDNAEHDFVIAPRTSQELTYYMPESRGEQSFTYYQGEQACLFSFGHKASIGNTLNRWVTATSTGALDIHCTAELIPVPDTDEYVRNGGTRVLFTMG